MISPNCTGSYERSVFKMWSLFSRKTKSRSGSHYGFSMVAGAGFEPATSGL